MLDFLSRSNWTELDEMGVSLPFRIWLQNLRRFLIKTSLESAAPRVEMLEEPARQNGGKNDQIRKQGVLKHTLFLVDSSKAISHQFLSSAVRKVFGNAIFEALTTMSTKTAAFEMRRQSSTLKI